MQVYGPATACLWDDRWDGLDEAERGARMPWQGGILVGLFLNMPYDERERVRHAHWSSVDKTDRVFREAVLYADSFVALASVHSTGTR